MVVSKFGENLLLIPEGAVTNSFREGPGSCFLQRQDNLQMFEVLAKNCPVLKKRHPFLILR